MKNNPDVPTKELCAISAGNLEEILSVWRSVELWPHTGEDKRLIAGALTRNRDYALGWRVEGKLVATTIGAFDGFRGWIYRVAVRPEHRRQGLAAGLVQAVEEKLWQAGARQINLMVHIPNLGARALYEKLGYEYCEVNVMRKRFQK
jgi:GNAT superfamily N-acetyltransferase